MCFVLTLPRYVDEYLFGPTGAGNPNISGFYFDDHWTSGGPSEMSGKAAADMGLSKGDLSDLVTAFDWVQASAFSSHPLYLLYRKH